jgi:hypothetical protein
VSAKYADLKQLLAPQRQSTIWRLINHIDPGAPYWLHPALLAA